MLVHICQRIQTLIGSTESFENKLEPFCPKKNGGEHMNIKIQMLIKDLTEDDDMLI